LTKEYLDKDIQLLNNFLPVLVSGKFDINTLAQINGIMISDKYGNLGLGYNKTTYYQNGGYIAISIKMLLDKNNNIIKYRIRLNGNIDALNLYNERFNLYSILNNYKNYKPGYPNYITYEFENINEELFNLMKHNFNVYFGVNNNIYIPNNIYNDYFLLTDPFDEGIYGFVVGIGATTPNGRVAIENIKKANNNEILMLIMASPNPIGRMYAIEAISNGNINNIRNNRIYSNILNQLIKLGIPIEVGSGCFANTITINSYSRINEAMNFIGF
jgi:hypothetical protein